ncbi:UPF0481 protein At3g47200-like [Diospyros lotus]|uniref:UPF0481 protein At3g47200-like n=1 Tax=Diospyros lotus TaxID=55363 RepID=UPI002252802B|nr:UPF0481 protein At3g47200-like [Diospyros lotus]
MDTIIIVQTDDGTALDMRTINEGVNKVADMAQASIFMVPERLRKLNETAYTPRLFSIGPLHSHNDPHLESPEIQNIKLSYLNDLLARVSDDPQDKDRILDRCLHEMENLKEVAKKSYAVDAEKAKALSKEMLVIDGCFILEFLYKHYNIDMFKQSRNDPIFGSVVMLNSIQHDLLLLENQLPFFVLEKLFQLTFNRIQSHPHSLTEYVHQFFRKVLSFNAPSPSVEGSVAAATTSGGGDKEKKDQEATMLSVGSYNLHILHLLYSYYHPPDQLKEMGPMGHAKKSRDSASELDFAGVNFMANNGDQFKVDFKQGTRITDWLFSSPEFHIPRLAIYDSTEQILRNLIAFEQCCNGVVCYMTSYAFLMDLLVNTNEDIEVLENAGVINNYLGARPEATNLFNNLCKQVVLENFDFANTYKNATDYSRHWWPAIRAYFIRKYLATPYGFIAFVAGAIYFVIEVVKFIDNYFV